MNNILLVDDSEETRELVRMVFAGTEQEVHIDYASSSREAIEFFNELAYNVCILDVSLPDLTGYYLGQLIRKACPDMPIAFLTNYEGTLTKENAEFLDAQFWAKGDVFSAPMQLKDMILELSSVHQCGASDKIQMPEIIKEIS